MQARKSKPSLSPAERRALAIVLPGGGVSYGLTLWQRMARRGLVQRRGPRYFITPLGIELIQQFPESGWELYTKPPGK